MEANRFKFRVWDLEEKEWISSTESDWYFLSLEGGEIACWYDHQLGTVMNDHVVMQSTGLLDRNGKEIFEGDVVEEAYGMRGEIFWNKSEMMWDARGWNIAYLSDALRHGVTVIGNRFENPELVEDDS